MENQNAAVMRRSRRVPRWFCDILHEIMYSDIAQAYSMLCAMDRLSSGSDDERTMVLLFVTGLSRSEIAEHLGLSRFAVRRRIEVLRKRWNFDFVAAMKCVGPISGLLVRFAERRGHENRDIAFVLRSLAGFSVKELGVLFAIAKEQSQEEALDAISISRSHYIRVRSKFIGMFGMSSRASAQPVSHIIGNQEAECGIIQCMNREEHIAPIAAAKDFDGVMACADAAQNAAVHASCIPPPCYQQSRVTPLKAGFSEGVL